MNPRELVARYVELHNQAKWTELGDLFRKDAVLAFLGLPVGPFVGRDAIAQAYVDRPPTDRLVILSMVEEGTTLDARYAWSANPNEDAGGLRFVCVEGGIAALLVSVRT